MNPSEVATRRPAPFWSLEWWRGEGSPGLGGYALAVLVSAPALGVLAAGSVVVEEGVGGSLVWAVVISFYALMFCLPFAVPGVLVVHLVCRRVRSQWVHVAVAGLAGVLAGVAASWWLTGGSGLGFAWQLGLATAIGRAAVIPLVAGVRHR